MVRPWASAAAVTCSYASSVKLRLICPAAHSFNEATLRQTLGAIAQRSRATGEDIDRALEEGFRQEVAHAMSDGILTHDEEERLRTFRDRLALENSAADPNSLAELDRAGADRVVMEARLAAISVRDGDGHLRELWDSPSVPDSAAGPHLCGSWGRRTLG